MTTTTPAEIHRVISAALDDRAKLLRHDAASRKWKGPDFAGIRDGLRAEARLADDLHRILGHVSPGKLAAALEADMNTPAEPKFAPSDKAIWTGTADLFERAVTIADVRPSGLLIFGEHPGTGPLVYDIHDAEVVKGIIYGIPAEQLRPAQNPEA